MVSVYTIENYIVLGCLAVQVLFQFILLFVWGFSPMGLFNFFFNIFLVICIGCAPFGWLKSVTDLGTFASHVFWRPAAIIAIGGQGIPGSFDNVNWCYWITCITGFINLIIGLQFLITDICNRFAGCNIEPSTAPLEPMGDAHVSTRAKVTKSEPQANDVEAK